MSILEIIKNELKNVSSWTEMLISNIDDQLWKTTPENIGTNFNWLVGHIIHDKYFHAIACISKQTFNLTETLDTSNYQQFYEVGTSPTTALSDKPGTTQLKTDLQIVDSAVNNVLDNLSEQDLQNSTLLNNPVADTKYEALMWAIKHQMWHNGQIALMKRILTK